MRSQAQLNCVSVRAAHVFFSCIRFTSKPLLETVAQSSVPALRISHSGGGIVLIDCYATAPASVAIVCHVKHRLFDDHKHRSDTPTYFSNPRSAPGSPTFRTNASSRRSSTPLMNRSGTPNSESNSSYHEMETEPLDVLTLAAWRCKVQDAIQGFGCVRARCMLLQCTLKRCTRSACEAHGYGALLQLLRCFFEQCGDCMLICNSEARMHVFTSFFSRCSAVARCVDRASLVIFSCALENVSHSAVTATQASSVFCSNCYFKEVGLEYNPPPAPLQRSPLRYGNIPVFTMRSDAAPPYSLRLAAAAVCCWTQFFAGSGSYVMYDV